MDYITVEIPMRQIRVTIVSMVALIMLYFIYTQARAIAAPETSPSSWR